MKDFFSKKSLLIVLVTVVITTFSFSYLNSEKDDDCEKRFNFINKKVVCSGKDVVLKTGYAETQKNISSFIDVMKIEGKIEHAAVYFRDLEHGPVFGVNELSSFSPASLLKLPLAFVFLSSAEAQPELLLKKIQYTGTSTVSEQRIKPKESASPNTPYTIEELLRMMISFSDNASYEALESFLNADAGRSNIRLETLQELGLIDPRDRIEKTVTVRGYSSLFRILYNSSFLKEEYSEKLLLWLTEDNYHEGIEAGVPEDIEIAHKFGERFLQDSKQLHDCGIVYYPQNPYLICVMTIGDDFEELEYVIKEISSIVYQEFNSRKL